MSLLTKKYMKKIIGKFVVFAVFVMLAWQLPNILLAAGQSGGAGGGSGGSAGDGIQDRDQTQDRDRIQDPTINDGDEPDQDRDQIRDQDRTGQDIEVEEVDTDDEDLPQDQNRIREQERLQLNLENVPQPAGSINQLRQMIQTREEELNREASEEDAEVWERNTIRNTNQVRLAVHALLSAKNVLGGIGPQVSEIAQQINNSVQATVNTEAKIQTRSSWARFFFGGDKSSADLIQAQVERNRERIQELNQLMEEGNISLEVRNMLQEQIQIMEQEQTRLLELADQEKGDWGLFSWRFGSQD